MVRSNGLVNWLTVFCALSERIKTNRPLIQALMMSIYSLDQEHMSRQSGSYAPAQIHYFNVFFLSSAYWFLGSEKKLC